MDIPISEGFWSDCLPTAILIVIFLVKILCVVLMVCAFIMIYRMYKKTCKDAKEFNANDVPAKVSKAPDKDAYHESCQLENDRAEERRR